ncbi:hypothetical protein V1511DRAFT_153025 [Dipodascopsis uninucleata]
MDLSSRDYARYASQKLQDDRLEDAVLLYTKAIEAEENNGSLSSSVSSSSSSELPNESLLVSLLDKRAECYERARKLSKALDDAKQVVRRDRSSPRGYIRCGRLFERQNKYDLAIKVYKSGIKAISASGRDISSLQRALAEVERSTAAQISDSKRFKYQATIRQRNKRAVFNLDPLRALPVELVTSIFIRLELADLCRSMRVCTTWRSFVQNSSCLWLHLNFTSCRRDLVSNKVLRTCIERANKRVSTLILVNVPSRECDRCTATVTSALDRSILETLVLQSTISLARPIIGSSLTVPFAALNILHIGTRNFLWFFSGIVSGRFPLISTVKFYGDDATPVTAQHVSQLALQSPPTSCSGIVIPALQSFAISASGRTRISRVFLQAIATYFGASLISFCLNGVVCSSDDGIPKALDLRVCRQLRTVAFECVADLDDAPSIPATCTTLSLSHCNVLPTPNDGSQFEGLRVLEITHCFALNGQRLLGLLSRCSPEKLRRLSISNCPNVVFSGADGIMLANQIIGYVPLLEALNLSGNISVVNNTLSDFAVLERLEAIDLSFTAISFAGLVVLLAGNFTNSASTGTSRKPSIADLSRKLASRKIKPTLKTLSISGCQEITPDAADFVRKLGLEVLHVLHPEPVRRR